MISEIQEYNKEVKEHVSEGNIIVFEAPQRYGKTLGGCLWSLDAHQHGKTVYSTLAFKFPYKPLNFNQLKLENSNNPLRNGHLFIDELNMYLDARASMSKVNREFASFLLQVKKQGLTLTGTTHHLDYLDKRFRQNYDYKIQTEVFPKFPNTPDILRMKIQNGPTTRYCNKTITIKVRPFLGLYDTLHVFNPFDGMSTDKTNELKQKKELAESRKIKRVASQYEPTPNPKFNL